MKYLMVLLVLALAFTACTNTEVSTNEEKDISVTTGNAVFEDEKVISDLEDGFLEDEYVEIGEMI
ncbi:hypothetical protein C0585_06750 [Candidatus Woesearchaeota archaeon]|nr:MAG: hypothetical protein C0585_06750 [Candidatus Woesearchaeota archaeon]